MCRPWASATEQACAARSAVNVRSISVNNARNRKAILPLPSSAVLMESGRPGERTPMPPLGDIGDEVEVSKIAVNLVHSVHHDGLTGRA
jgi:hypothetical protein